MARMTPVHWRTLERVFNSGTDSSLDFARDCGYITAQQHLELTGLCQEVDKMLGSIINNPTSFLLSAPCPLRDNAISRPKKNNP